MTPLTIKQQTTHDSDVMRLVADRLLNPGAPQAFYSEEDARQDPFAAACFGIDGVTGLMIVNDFCDVQKASSAKWDELLPLLEQAIRTHWTPEPATPDHDDSVANTTAVED